MGGESVADWMRNDVLMEEGAISHYKEHIALIDDPKIKRLLQRILSDEESHHGDFVHFVEKAQREKARDLRGSRADKVVQTLNWGIAHEYTVILQYMFQSYMTTDEEAKKEFEDQAINEMQHLGWLAEKMIDISGRPGIEHTEVDRSTRTADMLQADIKIEQEVAAEYDRAAKETEDPGLKKLLIRIRDHEIYHAEVFSDILKKEKRKD
jgi:bacterioferritin